MCFKANSRYALRVHVVSYSKVLKALAIHIKRNVQTDLKEGVHKLKVNT